MEKFTQIDMVSKGHDTPKHHFRLGRAASRDIVTEQIYTQRGVPRQARFMRRSWGGVIFGTASMMHLRCSKL